MLIRAAEASFAGPVLVPVSSDVSFAAWDEATAASGQVAVSVDGNPVPRPYVSVRLATRSGETRVIIAFRAGELPDDCVVEITRAGAPVGRIDVEARLRDPAPLLDGLDAPMRARLLRFVLGMCCAGFALGTDKAYASFCRRLALALTPQPAEFPVRARLTSAAWLHSGALGLPLWANTTVHLLGAERVVENPFAPVQLAGTEGEAILAVAASMPRRGALAVIVADAEVAVLHIPPANGAPHLVELAERGQLKPIERHYALRCLGALGDDPEARPVACALQLAATQPVRELADPKRPVAAGLDLAVGCGEAGLFVSGWIRDPHGLVREAQVTSPFGTARLSEAWHRIDRPDIEARLKLRRDAAKLGFVALVPSIVEPFAVLQHGLRLDTAAGTIEIVSAPRAMTDAEARNAILGSVSDAGLTPAMLANTIAPAAAALHARAMAAQGEAEIVEIGELPADPTVSIVIPLYRNLSFLRMQIGAFAVDPELRAAELVFVLDSPEQRGELEHLLRGLHALTGLAFKLVVMPNNFGYASANNAGVRASRGEALLLLNSDVIPTAPGWLGGMLAALRQRGVGAVGPKLLFDDGSLQHAGLMFERDFRGDWYNNHYHKGYPRDWAPANAARSVPGVTGAALLARRSAYESVGGFSQDYIIGDYEDSDLCLKLRQAGWDIRYEPSVELYHFERRSISLHAGYTRTVASAYNRRLHALRWSEAMALLMEAPRPADRRRAA